MRPTNKGFLSELKRLAEKTRAWNCLDILKASGIKLERCASLFLDRSTTISRREDVSLPSGLCLPSLPGHSRKCKTFTNLNAAFRIKACSSYCKQINLVSAASKRGCSFDSQRAASSWLSDRTFVLRACSTPSRYIVHLALIVSHAARLDCSNFVDDQLPHVGASLACALCFRQADRHH